MSSEKTEERREAMRIWGPTAVIVLVGFVIAWQFVDPPPPSRITLATAREDGSYHAYGVRYAKLLEKEGITVDVRSTAGSIENLELLQKGEVDVAFVQSGTGYKDRDGLISLASVYLEPLWIFYRAPEAVDSLLKLRGKRINAGPVGSGSRALAIQLLEANGLTSAPTVVKDLPRRQAADALMAGELDAAIFIISPQAPIVRELLSKPELRLMSVRRSRAYESRYPFLTPAVLGAGMVELDADVPSTDVSLLATTATLVSHEDFHPALIPLLVEATVSVHKDENLFLEDRQFPNDRFVDLPVSSDASRYFKSGRSFLYRVLPFRVASIVDRMKVLLLPLVTLLIPLMKLAPPLYRWRVRRRVFRWYRKLRDIDRSVGKTDDPEALMGLTRRVADVESEVREVKVPLSYAHELYHLKLHTWLVRERLRRRRAGDQDL